MMAAKFGKKIVISMKSTNVLVLILPRTKRFKVLCVSIANYGVNNEKSKIHGLPGGFNDSTLNNDIIHYQ